MEGQKIKRRERDDDSKKLAARKGGKLVTPSCGRNNPDTWERVRMKRQAITVHVVTESWLVQLR
jgi:hypothetical protein